MAAAHGGVQTNLLRKQLDAKVEELLAAESFMIYSRKTRTLDALNCGSVEYVSSLNSRDMYRIDGFDCCKRWRTPRIGSNLGEPEVP